MDKKLSVCFVMSKLFLHYEAEPSFTLKIVLGQTQVQTVEDVVQVRCESLEIQFCDFSSQHF